MSASRNSRDEVGGVGAEMGEGGGGKMCGFSRELTSEGADGGGGGDGGVGGGSGTGGEVEEEEEDNESSCSLLGVVKLDKFSPAGRPAPAG